MNRCVLEIPKTNVMYLIEKNSWLDAKGNEEQKHDYLMQKCRLRIYISFKLSNVENANVLKFKD